uniref:Uncharacterized protein n=1 Tax=Angiostrongylus cantonensis TaxID=6313 RepID=A0A0K0CVQ0_ANGCA
MPQHKCEATVIAANPNVSQPLQGLSTLTSAVFNGGWPLCNTTPWRSEVRGDLVGFLSSRAHETQVMFKCSDITGTDRIPENNRRR